MVLSPCRQKDCPQPVAAERPDDDRLRNDMELDLVESSVNAYVEVSCKPEWKGDVCYGD